MTPTIPLAQVPDPGELNVDHVAHFVPDMDNASRELELLREAAAGAFHTVVVSANTDAAVRAFEYGVLDFVPKPFGRERLGKSFERMFDSRARADYGARFVALPGIGARPPDTGWLASFSALEQAQGGVGYPKDGARFLGSTFDPVGLYRLNAVIELLRSLKVSVTDIRAHAHRLQERFVAGLAELRLPALDPDRLLVPLAERNRGQFLTFETPEAGETHQRLMGANIIKVKPPTDHLDLAAAAKVYESQDIDRSTLTARIRHVMQASFAGKRIVVFSGGEAKDTEGLLNEIRQIRDGGGSGSIIGRNSFQRPKADAMALLDEVIKIYQGES